MPKSKAGYPKQKPTGLSREKRIKWFQEARFGMFIHWGLYAIPGRGEWVRYHERISNEDYQPFFDEFNPVNYNPVSWARAAKAAGQKYAVMTAKHHDGFCLFDSQVTDYKATNTKAGRDLIREYVDAFRAEGLKVGLYYSLLDWHHPDYPIDIRHPMRATEQSSFGGPAPVATCNKRAGGAEKYRNQPRDFSKYLDYFHAQVRELLTNYGTIDIIWFDFSYDGMRGEKWRATELIKMVRALQPGIIINNRLGGSISSKNQETYAGDFTTPEQIIPPEGIVDENRQPVPWEACLTLNDNWGYTAADRAYKTPKHIIRSIIECVSKNGNALLNVGPNAKGEIPEESLGILSEVGRWLAKNGAGVYGCGLSELPKPEWGRYTRKGKTIYAHVYDMPMGPLNFRGLNGKVSRARLVADGSELKIYQPWNAKEYSDDAFINFPGASLPDEWDTVIALELL